jgi:anti-sigma-K factor RskA
VNHDSRDAHLMSGAYVLHSLDAEERAVVEAASAHSEELRSEIAELSDTAVELGLAVKPAVPPAAMRARVLDLVADAPQLPARSDEPASATVAPVSAAPPASGPAARAARPRWFLRPVVLAAAAAVAAVLFVGGLGFDRILTPEPQGNPQLTALIGAADVQSQRAQVAGGGTATVYSSAHLAESAIVLDGVAQPSDGRVLQVWRLSGGTATSIGLYRASSAGYLLTQHALAPLDRLAVTVEPAGGSKQPTTRPLVALSA